jgi:DNA-binding transcriptional MerR regulator
MAPDDLWTIDELSAEVADALVVDYAGPPSGRVREVPDRRTIRWYTTIGLLDRPVAMRSRTALYGRRHLLQLVAIKRMQADGASLAAVQQELYGATDATLSRIARLTADHAPTRNGATPAPARFWAVAPPAPTLVHGIELADSVTLMLPSGTRPPDADDLAAIQDAAGQLLAVLRQRGLAPSEGNAHDNAG